MDPIVFRLTINHDEQTFNDIGDKSFVKLN